MRTLPKGISAPLAPVVSVGPLKNVEMAAELAAALLAEDDETLVADVRAGVTPAEMVELKLRSLLRTRGVSTQQVGRERHFRGHSVRG